MRLSILASLAVLASLSVVLLAANSSRARVACPLPTEALGGECVLRDDVTLSDTMPLPSGTQLNCRGYQITPFGAGSADDPRTAANEFQPSHPDLALFVHRSYNVKIQNCVISGFDFGIIVAQSKSEDAPAGAGPLSNKILGNTIDVRTNPIDVINSDNVLITDNWLRYAAERGRGVVVDYDSDGNQIRHNTIISTDAASTGQVRQLPGGPFVASTAIMDIEIHCLQSDKPLQNFVVGGVLYQVASGDLLSDFEDSGRSDHNLIEANDIIDLGAGPSCTFDPGTSCRADADCVGKGTCLLKQNSGIGFNLRAADNTVRGNQVSGRMDRGISFGGVSAAMTLPNWFPGTCALDPNRLCSGNSDCNIQGHDTASLGSCMGVGAATFNGNSLRLLAEDNVLSGTYDTAALFATNTDQFVFRRNTANGGASGVRINPAAINGTIEHNVVSGFSNALYLVFQPSFTNAIRLNDFTQYSVAIRTSNDFTTMTDVSADAGNYWGLPCPGFDPARVLFDNGAANPNVFDGKPYGRPVATTSGARVPKGCR